MGFKSTVAALLLAAPAAFAHPGPEKVYQHNALPLEARGLSQCSKQFAHPEFMKRTTEIHGAELLRLRRALGYEKPESRAIHERDYISVSKINHLSNKTVSWNMDPATLFADAGACILMPAVDQGPLYVQGEEIRKNITNGEAGVRMTLVIQVVDYKTCEVVPDAYVDIWSSNSTGMYMGVQGYPGMGDLHDTGMLKGTAFRGIQLTDSHGIVTFDTALPGHYTGRATHIHAIVYQGATKNANNTISGGHASHVGQLYFDMGFIQAYNQLAPYKDNKMVITQNSADFLFMQGANGDDPIVRYSLVGKTIEEGVFAWIRFGVNQNNKLAVSPAAFATPSGVDIMNPKGPIAQLYGGKLPFKKLV